MIEGVPEMRLNKLIPLFLCSPLVISSLVCAEEPVSVMSLDQLQRPVRIDSTLQNIDAQLTANRVQARSAVPNTKNSASLAGVVDGYVVVDAVAENSSTELRTALESLGMLDIGVYANTISGRFPVEKISELERLPSLKFVRMAYAVSSVSGSSSSAYNTGTVTTQGNKAHWVDQARSLFKTSGAGVKVAVLADSYNCLGGAATAITAGDLPAAPTILKEGPCTLGVDEGQAMMEIVHDVAPNAELLFRTARIGMADMANAVKEAVAANVDVIVDDIVHLSEPIFQDGLIAQEIDKAKAQGVSYFTAAGNAAANSYEANFRPSGRFFDGEELHDFDPGVGIDTCQQIDLPAGAPLLFSLQWDQPFFTVTGSQGSANDLDILFMDETCSRAIYALGATSNVGRDARESFAFTNPTTSTQNRFGLQIMHYNPPAPTPALPYAGRVKVVSFFQGSFAEYATHSSTTYGHQNAASGLSVGAAYYQDTPAFGVTPAVLQVFSSLGGSPILFDVLGNRLTTPLQREQPAVVAADGVDTSLFSTGIDLEGNGFPNFIGTSAAAPHVAGIAALMLEANSSLSPDSVYSGLKKAAFDMDNPYTTGFDKGFDYASGYGFIHAGKAVWSAMTTCNGKSATIIGTPRADVLIGTKGSDVIVGLDGDDRINGLEGDDIICGGRGKDYVVGSAGNDQCSGEKTVYCETTLTE